MVWNHVQFEGRAGKDAEARQTQNGKTITSFTLAVNQGKDKPPIWLQIKKFDDCIAIKKGDKLQIEGRLTFEEWTDRDGNKRQSWGVLADSVTMQTPQDIDF